MNYESSSRLTGSLIVMAVATILGHGTVATAQPQSRQIQFHISDQRLAGALNEFARQSDRQILFSNEVVNAKHTKGVQGELEPEVALQEILKGTGLTYRLTADDTILVEGTPAADTASVARPENYIQLAQLTEQSRLESAGSEKSAAAKNSSEPEKNSQAPEELIVTGTLIRGIAPAGTSTVAVTSQDVAATGVSTTVDLLKSIPQVGQFLNYDVGLATNNFISVNRPNLRNLPNLQTSSTNPTLILVDGHRLPNTGIKQTAPDPDVVPPGVIERVEVIPDGGSSIYGTDAVGGVINFITKKRFDGVQAEARYGFADEYWTMDGNGTVGHDWGSGSAYVAYSFAKRDAIFGRDRDFMRKFDVDGSLEPDLNCASGNGVVISGSSQTVYALPGLQPNTRNRCDNSDYQTHWPQNEQHSFFAGFSQDLNDSITADVRGFHTKRTTDFLNTFTSSGTISPSNPYYRRRADNPAPQAAQPYTVFFNWEPVLGRDTATSRTITESWGVTPTITADLGGNWQVRVLANYGEGTTIADNDALRNLTAALSANTTAAALNPYDIAATDPAVIRNLANWELYGIGEHELMNFRAIADGRVMSLPGGDLRAAIGAEYIGEKYRSKQANIVPGTQDALPWAGAASRNNKSVFGELSVPIVGRPNAIPGIESLELSLSGRLDDYSDFGDTFNPKVAFTYVPLHWLSIRGNWGESFNAPSLVDGAGAPDTQVTLISARTLADPYPGGFTAAQATWPMIVRNGAVEGIEPQTATTKQIGADIRLPFLEGNTTVSVTYWNIHFKDIIGFPPANNLLLLWGPYRQFITVAPTQAQVEEVAGGVPGGLDVVAGLFAPGALPVYALFDARRRNLGQAKLGGLDFSVNYVRPTDFGSFDIDVSGSYDLQRDSQALEGAIWTDDLVADTNRVRVATKLGVNIGDLRAQTTWYRRQGYDLTPTTANNQQTKADSFDVIDLFLRYDFSGQTGQLRDLSLTLNVSNVFDADPPIYRGAAQNAQFGYVNGFTIGRLFQFGVSKKW